MLLMDALMHGQVLNAGYGKTEGDSVEKMAAYIASQMVGVKADGIKIPYFFFCFRFNFNRIASRSAYKSAYILYIYIRSLMTKILQDQYKLSMSEMMNILQSVCPN